MEENNKSGKNLFFVHHLSDVQSVNIGKGTNIWQYCVILKNSIIGSNCNICANCFIENKVVIGNNVTIKNNVQIWDGITIENNVFIGPNVTFTNDKYPISRRKSEEKIQNFPKTLVKKGASIGGGAVILPGITINENVLVAAGAIVTQDVPRNSLVLGHKGEIKKRN